MIQIASWVFLGLAAGFALGSALTLPMERRTPTIGIEVPLVALVCAVIAGVLRLP